MQTSQQVEMWTTVILRGGLAIAAIWWAFFRRKSTRREGFHQEQSELSAYREKLKAQILAQKREQSETKID